jgi:hypothetical protein
MEDLSGWAVGMGAATIRLLMTINQVGDAYRRIVQITNGIVALVPRGIQACCPLGWLG